MIAAAELRRNKRGLESLTRSTDIRNTILDNYNETDQKVSFFVNILNQSHTLGR